MKAWLIRLCVLLLLLSACALAPTASPQVRPSETLSHLQTPTSPPPAASPTFTPPATATPLPPIPVSYYRLRIEFSTTSDWTDLVLKNPEGVLTARSMEVVGDPTHVAARVDQLALNQPLAAAEAGQSVGVTLDLALSPEAAAQPLDFRLEKGNLNGSVVRVYNIAGDEQQLLREISHQGEIGTDGRNSLDFSIDLGALQSVSPLEAQIQRVATPKLLWAFYYPWYSRQDWSSTMLRDRPLMPYVSRDQRAMERHIQQAQDAGIDGFISSWWGPGDPTDQILKTLLDLAQERNFRITIYFETLTGEGPLREGEIAEWLAYAISTYRDHPAFMKVNGKPLIVLWASGTVPRATWENIFAGLRSQGLDAAYLAMSYDTADLQVFDGLHDYGIFTIPDLAATFAATGKATRYYSLLSDKPTQRIWAATVQAGYDDRLIPGRAGSVQDRLDGDFYRSTFEAALESDPDWIFITTWNEWWEHTHIEPSELYGDLYLQITREFALRWKGG